MARRVWGLIGLVVCGLGRAEGPVPADLMPEPKQVKIERAKRELAEQAAEAARRNEEAANRKTKAAQREIEALKSKLRAKNKARAVQKPPTPVTAALPAPSARHLVALLSTFRDCPDCPEMVVIPGGKFRMGSPTTEKDRGFDEGPVHSVKVKPFALGKFEVTQEEWKSVMGSNPSYFNECGPRCPVEDVSWNDAQEFIRKLNEKLGLVGRADRYRLPSEAEWEYAARAGTTGPFSFEGPITVDKANYDGNSYADSPKGQFRGKTVEVGSLPANPWGLHEMHGNVYEWVEDCYHGSYNAAPKDGSAWTTGCQLSARVFRGGSWDGDPRNLRSASRDWITPDFRVLFCGFRLARTLPE